MKIIHIVCMVLMIAMMQHTCLADEQIEITYGDGWTHYNYTDGTQAHKLAPLNYLRWDGEWRPKTEMNISSGDWPYLVEDLGTYYLITRLDDSLTLSISYRTYDFQPCKIGVTLSLTPIQLNGMSTYHNVGGIDYWYITIPRSLKESSKHLNWDNKLPIISNETGFILNQSDNVSGVWIPNYKYQNVGGELRLYYGQTARNFGAVGTEITFDFNSYIINGSTSPAWQNTSFDNTTINYGTYNIELEHIVPGYISYWRGDDTAKDDNRTSSNDGSLSGGMGYTTGLYDSAFSLDGTNDNVCVGITGFSTTAGTISAAIYIPATWDSGQVDDDCIFEFGSLNTDRVVFYLNDDGKLRFLVISTTAEYAYSITSSFSPGWYNITGTFNSSAVELYIEGVKQTSAGSGKTLASISSVIIGDSSLASSIPFYGDIDNLFYFDRVLSTTEINNTRDNHHQLTGNVTHWYDAGSGYQTASFVVNMTTPTNTNYTVLYADNGSSFSQIGGTYTGNQTLSISGTKYQNTDLRIVMNGNTTATPEEIEVMFVTEASPTPTPTPTPTSALTSSVSPGYYDELDLALIIYILMISMLYLLIAFRNGVATIELSLIYLIFAFFFLLFQTVTMSVNYIYLTLFLLLFLISIAGIILKQGVD